MSSLDDLIKENQELKRTISDMTAKINKAGWMINGDSLVRIPPKGEVTCDNCGKKFIKRLFKYNAFEHTFCCSKCASEYKKKQKTYKISKKIVEKDDYVEIHVFSKKLGECVILIDSENIDKCKDLTISVVQYNYDKTYYARCRVDYKQTSLGNYLFGKSGFVVFYKNGNALDNRKNNIELRKRGNWSHNNEV